VKSMFHHVCKKYVIKYKLVQDAFDSMPQLQYAKNSNNGVLFLLSQLWWKKEGLPLHQMWAERATATH